MMRTELHRIVRGAETAPATVVAERLPGVDGSGTVTVGDRTWIVRRGDLLAVPSWTPFSAESEAGKTDSNSGALNLFRFVDTPVCEALQLNRMEISR